MAAPTFDPGFSTEELTAVYSANSTVAAMLEFEAALALALADAGIAPPDEAEDVAAACRAGVADPEAIVAATWAGGTPIIALRESLGAGKWFHYGATSQDAIDTGQMIQAKTALGLIEPRLFSIAHRLRVLTIEHREQPHMGRTFLQDARPTTFGFRTATWLDASLGHLDELRSQRSSLPIQLGGPVGTRQSYGDSGTEVAALVAERLDLQVPAISWHANRTRVVSLAQSVERMARSMAKIGGDVALLASTPVAEITVRSGGSSSMPEKRNPIDAIRAVAAATACSGAADMLTSVAGHELDRGVGGWHVEWLALPLVLQTAGASAEAVGICLDSLQVDREVMSANAGDGAPAIDRDQIDRVLAACDETLG